MVLMRDADKFDPTRGSLAAYLYGIARNLVLRSFQKERPLVAFSEEDEDEGGPAGELVAHHDPLGDLTRGETVARVRQAVLALPEHYREVVVLCELHEMSYAEAAEALECAVGTVRSRLHRGRALLVERLRHDGHKNAAPQAFNTARCFA